MKLTEVMFFYAFVARKVIEVAMLDVNNKQQ